ncbi:TPA: tail assembly protein [Pseudomonas aeruginosa]|uniref:tail assembly protein n=1 Tax=Pseudomonas aeruginosa TaxID=287 RepID=UPI00053D5264|nr:tail assembly protein [Pseudomonas aeruginosa]MBG4575957.1 tail assembly protein [Pseudomonas aeruginosa]HCF1056438.1 tail assembly protein [Pseudomonas aeruginosa]HEJ4196798.1 tail assembly protein [Pseudomonas aeruginosa]
MTATVLDHQPMTIIKLSGPLIREFGREHRRFLDTGTTQEAFSALRNTLPGFKEAIQRLQNKGMRFAIFRNRKNISQDDLSAGGTREVRIVPVLTGSKRAGLLQTILGAVIFTASFFVPGMQGWGQSLGASLALGGVIQMLSPQAQGLKQSAAPENLPSYAFGSARNTTASGNPVPICYGKRRWGGAIISASIYAEDKV